MIDYLTSADGIQSNMLSGFFVEWPTQPNSATHLRILLGSNHVILAMESNTKQIVGFITAISDGVSAAYIPHLEVLPNYQGQGIGSELMRRLLEQLNEIYMIDLMCDADVVPFYERAGFRQSTGMIQRNYQNQSGLTG